MERDPTKQTAVGSLTTSSAAGWDQQFSAGAWSYLGSIDELAHHSVIAGYVSHFGKPLSVLDVACGEGHLRRLLPRHSPYLGVDWSAVAIEQARRQECDANCFVVADAESYVPDRAFDIIIFNECLYYFGSATGTLKRYVRHLKPDGCFIVSMYDAEGNQRIWHDIETNFTLRDRIRVSNSRGTAWQIALFAQPI
jgi:SAM-dependent methyltransferase